MEKVIALTILWSVFLPGFFVLSAGGDQADVYEVTASILMVRESPNTKAPVLLKLPRGSYVLNYDNSMQSQLTETIAGVNGRWLKVMGFHAYDIGYAFEGFLKKQTAITYRDFETDCQITAASVICGKDAYNYKSSTPLTGAYFLNPETEGGNLTYIQEKNMKKLRGILKGPKLTVSDGGNGTMILKGNNILQFIVVPTPRGYN